MKDPYNRDNKERVRRDEEQALKEEAEKEKYIAARERSERIFQLRNKRDSFLGIKREDGSIPSGQKHVNFWEDFEAKQAEPNFLSHTMRNQQVDLKPWYTQPKNLSGFDHKRDEHDLERAKRCDEKRKHDEDPLETVRKYVKMKPESSGEAEYMKNNRSLQEERHRREAHEAERAAALKKQRSFFRTRARALREARVEH